MAAQRAARVIVPTVAVKEDVVAHLRVDPQRVTVIAEAAAPVMTPRDDTEVAKVRRRYGLPQDYLVWVGGLEYPDPRKRVAELADTPRDLPLVLVGPAKHWAYEMAGDRPDITVTGHVADDDLAAIYTGARALVLPSDDEGFGLPTVEALACGTPVVACDVPALREVLGDRATFVECDDLTRLLAVAAEATRPAPGPPPWTWEDAARSTWATYRDVAGDGAA
jgi:alpha-1,3-rhamnosyl/mannosyltransferase